VRSPSEQQPTRPSNQSLAAEGFANRGAPTGCSLRMIFHVLLPISVVDIRSQCQLPTGSAVSPGYLGGSRQSSPAMGDHRGHSTSIRFRFIAVQRAAAGEWYRAPGLGIGARPAVGGLHPAEHLLDRAAVLPIALLRCLSASLSAWCLLPPPLRCRARSTPARGEGCGRGHRHKPRLHRRRSARRPAPCR